MKPSYARYTPVDGRAKNGQLLRNWGRESEIIAKIQLGMHYWEIAEEFGISRQRVHQIGKRAGVTSLNNRGPRPSKAEIISTCKHCAQTYPIGQYQAHLRLATHFYPESDRNGQIYADYLEFGPTKACERNGISKSSLYQMLHRHARPRAWAHRHYVEYTSTRDQLIYDEWMAGMSIHDLARSHGFTIGHIRYLLRKQKARLGLLTPVRPADTIVRTYDST